MSSEAFGSLTFPVQIPARDEAIHDPALTLIGSYLTACLNDQLNTSWQTVNPGKKFVETFSTSNSDDSFNEKDLPALFLSRQTANDERVTDDWTQTTTDIQITWVPQSAVQAKRTLRVTGVNGFQKVITRAIELGRSPAWIDPADDDDTAETLGSVLITRAKLFRWPMVVSVRADTVSVIKGQTTVQYPAFTCILRIHEITKWDESFDSITMANRAPSKLDDTITSGAFSLQSLIPTT